MNEQVPFPVIRLDRISVLPDEIICTILSNLPVEESARTSILSKRWCKIWLLSPIAVSDQSIIKQSFTYSTQEHSSYDSWIVHTMCHIISMHPGPIHTCHFTLPKWDGHHKTLKKLLRTLTLKAIQILKIHDDYDGLFLVPGFVLESESLVDVEFRSVSILDRSRTGRKMFPNLRKLTLVQCNYNSKSFNDLISSKSIIELNLSGTDLGDVVIESHSMQKFSVKLDDYTELIIKDAPNLESFNYYDLPRNSKLVILHAPKLKILSCIDMHVSMFQLGNYRFRFHVKYMKIHGEISYMSSLRSLNIVVHIGRSYVAKLIPRFLECFPCLEILQVKIIDDHDDDCSSSSSNGSSSDDEYDDKDKNEDIVVADDDYANYDHLISNVNCLNHHLKVLRVENYIGRQSHLDFANLISAKARVLETVILVCGNDFEDKWIEAQSQFLLQNGASKMLRVEFVKESLISMV